MSNRRINNLNRTQGSPRLKTQTHGGGNLKRHAEKSLNRMFELYQHNQLTDVTLIAGEKSVHAHRIVLASVSDYFASMFTSTLKESRSSEIIIHGVDGNALYEIVTYSYNGRIKITPTTVEETLSAAVLFGLSDVISYCSDFMKTLLDPSNCVGIADFADTRSCFDLRDAAINYTSEHFVDVLRYDEYLFLSSVNFAKLIASDDLNVPSEEIIFNALSKWLEHDEENRKEHLKEVLKSVKLPLLPTKFLTDVVEPRLGMEGQCFVLDALKCQVMPDKMKSISPFLVTPRKSTSGLLYVLGGSDNMRCMGTPNIEVYSPRCNQWTIIGTMPACRLQLGAAISGHKLYVIGGRDGLKTVSSAQYLDLAKSKWFDLTPMFDRRHGLGVATLDPCGGPLYAIGGSNGWNYLSSVEQFDPYRGQWTKVAAMPSSRSALGIGILHNRIYAVGGRDGVSCINDVAAYDPLSNKWTRCSPMNERRGGVAVATLGGYMYAIGGYNKPPSVHPAVFRFNTVERYEPRMDGWGEVAALSVGRDGIGVAVLGGKVIAVGGYDGQNCVNLVEAYDPYTDSWSQESLPCRIKSVHIVNQPYVFIMLFAIFKPFIGEKLRNRIMFHGTNKSTLIEHIDPKFLPTQYGGTINLKTIYGPEFRKILCQYENEIEAINSRGFFRKNGTNEKR